MRGLVVSVDPLARSFVVSHESRRRRHGGDDDGVRGPRPERRSPVSCRASTVEFTLVVRREASYAEAHPHSSATQTVEQDPLAARRLRLLEDAAGPARQPHPRWPSASRSRTSR